jgi:hypothetical protein
LPDGLIDLRPNRWVDSAELIRVPKPAAANWAAHDLVWGEKDLNPPMRQGIIASAFRRCQRKFSDLVLLGHVREIGASDRDAS